MSVLATYSYTLINNDAEYSIVCTNPTTCTEAIIPSTYNGKPVTSIDGNAFYDCSSLTSITIPNSVTTISARAFRGCSSLTSIIIPDSVTSIGNFAFAYCPALEEINFNAINCADLTSGSSVFSNTGTNGKGIRVTFGDSVERIPSYLFHNSSITSVIIGNNVTSISTWAFAYCTSLTSITIPDSVTSIADGAFWGCNSLTSITIGDSITSIGNHAFRFCRSLKFMILIPKTPPTLSNTFEDAPEDIKIYCCFSAVNNYKTATNWSSYADNIIGDDIAVSFASNAHAINKTFVKKSELDKIEKRLTALGFKEATISNVNSTIVSSIRAYQQGKIVAVILKIKDERVVNSPGDETICSISDIDLSIIGEKLNRKTICMTTPTLNSTGYASEWNVCSINYDSSNSKIDIIASYRAGLASTSSGKFSGGAILNTFLLENDNGYFVEV